MKSRKTLYCTLDTETLGGASQPEGIYNLSGLIHDRLGNIHAVFNLIIAEHFNSILEKAHYGKATFYRYAEMIERGEVTLVPTEAEALALVDSLLSFYNVQYVMAYNTSFDLCKTSCKFLIENRNFIDIYQMAWEIFHHRPSYKKYCVENGFITKRGNPRQSVETTYGFLTKNPLFQEEHTAFSDASQEMEIFLACLRQHKKYSKNKHHGEYFARA